MAFGIPEPGLTPPEPAAACRCPACLDTLWEGDAVWRKPDQVLCREHLDTNAAQLLGYFASFAEVEDG